MNGKTYTLLAVAVVMVVVAVFGVGVVHAYSIPPITYNGKYEWIAAAQVPGTMLQVLQYLTHTRQVT